MYSQYADAALKNVSDIVNGIRYDVNIAKNCISALTPQVEVSGKFNV